MGRVVEMKLKNAIINLLLVVIIVGCLMLFDSSSETIIRLEDEAPVKYIIYMYWSMSLGITASALLLHKNFSK